MTVSAANKKVQDMQRRVTMIQEHVPVLSVSIHQNSYQDAGRAWTAGVLL